jgi:Zn-dependent protease with chaperone function
VHTLLALSALVLVILGGALALRLLAHLTDWEGRRQVLLMVLAAPVLSLASALGALLHFAGHVCFLGVPPWDYTLGLALPLGMGAVALGGIALGIVRFGVLARVFAERGMPAHPELQAVADALAARVGAPHVRILLCPLDRPLALASGLWRPRILLSTWTLDHLDRRELEAVLAHELGHIARRDYLAVWLSTVLRDAFCYLPTSWAAHRQLSTEKELACDDLAVRVTGRPLALASALAKVWQPTLAGAAPYLAQSFDGSGAAIEGRVERLLAQPAPSADRSRSQAGRPRSRPIGVAASALAALVVLQGVNAALLLAQMGCGPASALARFV